MDLSTQEITPTNPQPTTQSSSSSNKRRNRKKRKKSTSSIASGDSNNNADNNNNDTSAAASSNATTTILHSKLSLKKRLFLKKSSKQTPWYDTNELLETGRGLLLGLKLFPASSPHQQQNDTTATDGAHNNPILGLTQEEHNQLQMALHRVALWRGRSDRGGRLPHAIDMTAGLAGILLMDAERSSRQQNATTTNTSTSTTTTTNLPALYQLRNAYSTLLLRSVNGLADTYRHQKKSATLSVSHCCALAGLPLWIVDVRHDASHNELPSLGVCRIGALESLRFWRGRYWNSLEERVWGDVVAGEVEVDDGQPLAALSSSPSLSPQGGVCVLALDCLVRYQKAAMSEVSEREEQRLRQQQQHTKTAKVEKGRQKAEGPNQGEREAIINSKATNIGKTEADANDLIPVPRINENKSSSRKKMPEIKDQDRAADEPNPGRQSGGAIPWWILNDDKPKKKKPKTNADGVAGNTAEKKDTNGSIEAGKDRTMPSKAQMGDGMQPSALSQSVSTSRDCAAEFIRTISIDVAFSTALRFLVWGRTSLQATNNADGFDNPKENEGAREEMSCPALVELPPHLVLSAQSHPKNQTTPSSEQEFETAFEQLRVMYDPILIAMANAYPGFPSALFVHLADSILCLDDARRNQVQNNVNVGDTGNQMLDLSQLEHNIRYLSRWMHYILSREYHMHFDRSSAMLLSTASQQLAQPNSPPDQLGPAQHPVFLQDLKKKGRKKWTPAELEYMQGPLVYSSLSEIGFPLNSICDRFHSRQDNLPKCSISKTASNKETDIGELHLFLENVIGKQRVVFMGIYGHKDRDVSTERKHLQENSFTEAEEQSNAINEMGKDVPKSETKAAQESPLTTNILSLEDMEAMISEATEKNDCGTSVHTPGNTGHFIDGCGRKPLVIKPWALCAKWDACAIGTMPGYPS